MAVLSRLALLQRSSDKRSITIAKHFNDQPMTETQIDYPTIMTLAEIKHAAQELISLEASIEKARYQIDQHPGKDAYIETRLHCIRHWEEKRAEHYANLLEYTANLTQHELLR